MKFLVLFFAILAIAVCQHPSNENSNGNSSSSNKNPDSKDPNQQQTPNWADVVLQILNSQQQTQDGSPDYVAILNALPQPLIDLINAGLGGYSPNIASGSGRDDQKMQSQDGAIDDLYTHLNSLVKSVGDYINNDNMGGNGGMVDLLDGLGLGDFLYLLSTGQLEVIDGLGEPQIDD